MRLRECWPSSSWFCPVGGAEGGHDGSEVERRGEEDEKLAVILAVVDFMEVALLPL